MYTSKSWSDCSCDGHSHKSRFVDGRNADWRLMREARMSIGRSADNLVVFRRVARSTVSQPINTILFSRALNKLLGGGDADDQEEDVASEWRLCLTATDGPTDALAVVNWAT